MRWTAIFLGVVLGSGCTHNFLKQNTLRTASTLSGLQSEQVLDNFAMLACDPEANPWHLNLTSGLVQATDQGTGMVLGNVLSSGAASNNSLVASLSAQRALVEQWVVNPVTDGEQLETLRVAYRKALNPEDPSIQDDIIAQIVGLSVRFSLLPREETIRLILLREKSHKQAMEICQALNDEIHRMDARIALMKGYTPKGKDNRTKEAYDLEIAILDLVEKREFRKSQRDLLWNLAGKAGRERPARSATKSSAFSARRSQRSVILAESSDTTLLILTALQAESPAGYLPATDLIWESTRNPALVDQAEDQIERLDELLNDPEFQSPWVFWGTKKDVPRNACWVGHFKDGKRECYAWVMPEQYAVLRKFTQIILTLAATPPQDIPPLSLSPAFSPTLR